MSQALAEGKGRFPSSVCQFAVLAIVAGYSSVTSPSPAIPSATYHIPSISPVAPTATTASSLSPNASVFFRHSKPFHCERSWLLAAIWIIRRATLQYGQSSRRYVVSFIHFETEKTPACVHLNPVSQLIKYFGNWNTAEPPHHGEGTIGELVQVQLNSSPAISSGTYHLDQLKLQVSRIELLELLLGVGIARI
ncbi:unnamed protein product [Aspergillus oryzae]|uniref:Unnamed protein product n=1 Tax=Aspergillus oryzae var. brunneus TaxID=332754 RepID=A0ABQ6KUW9_ASPOZ|nr:unnamed protein product [Aspergillus oryzae]GMF92161.1 unnamed protein product [Aspergillus oryzae]GMG00509.1 unnamed protein product [Aspergillus oryzae]GMG49054.1 unnamed protein product [Aspergillus oryzae var. brunneus]